MKVATATDREPPGRPTAQSKLRAVLLLLPELLAIGACVAVIWGAVAFALWQARTTAVESARAQTDTLARAFAESSERISTVLDRELLALRIGIAEKGEAFDLPTWMAGRSTPDRMTIQMGYTDAHGIVMQTSVPMASKRIDLSDRDHFRAHLDPGRDALFISKPVKGRVSNQWSVQYSRKIVGADGRFYGVAVESASCDDLSRFYDTIDAGGGFILMAGLDGTVRAYGPVDPAVVGSDLAKDADFAPAFAGTEGSFSATAPWDGVPRMVAFRRLEQFPLVVMVGYDDGRIFRQYRPMAERALEIGGAATIAVVILGAVWIEQRFRSAASRRALLLTLENMSQGIVMIDAHGRIPVINRRAVGLLDLPAELLDPLREASRAEAYRLGLAIPGEIARDGGPAHDALHRHGRIVEAHSQYLPEGGLVRTYTDVTERRLADARIRHMAHHDTLTGLANRILLTDRVAELCLSRGQNRFGLIWLDLDGLKTVNETLGHDAGDRLLREVGRRLGQLGGTGILAARAGGDEFALLCGAGSQPESTASLAAKLLTLMQAPIDIDGTPFRLTVSAGLAFCPEDGATGPDLMKHAAIAMRQAKARGRGLIVNFDPDMDKAMRERARIERDLRQALQEKTLELWFQPRFDLNEQRISGFEALARWRHPERGFISPAEFIPIAEQCGLIADLGLWVLEEACIFATGVPEGRIAVNLSPVQFLSTNLAATIAEIVARYGLTSDRLELEVTEGVLIGDEAQAVTTLRGLRDLGLQLALDDFGTGYAGLSYLRRFPFDRIKIDQSFVREQEHDLTARAIVESVLTMARRLRLEVTAEGVETEAQLRMLIEQGCPEVQGFYLGRPMPSADALAFYNKHATEYGLHAA